MPGGGSGGVTDFLHGNSLVVWWAQELDGRDGASQCPLGSIAVSRIRGHLWGGGVHSCACAVSENRSGGVKGRVERAGAVVCLGGSRPFCAVMTGGRTVIRVADLVS